MVQGDRNLAEEHELLLSASADPDITELEEADAPFHVVSGIVQASPPTVTSAPAAVVISNASSYHPVGNSSKSLAEGSSDVEASTSEERPQTVFVGDVHVGSSLDGSAVAEGGNFRIPSSTQSNREASSPRSDDGRGECRICQEEDNIANLETPCACSGSVKFAHRKCVQRWCNEKGNIICEICNETYKNGYTAPVRRQLLHREDLPAQIRDDISLPFDHHGIIRRDSRVYSVTIGDRQFLEVEYEDNSTYPTRAAWCRSVVLILLALLLLRHAFVVAGTSGDDEEPGMFTLFVLRVIGILLPCYVMARALNLLHRRQEEQEAALMSHPEGSVNVALLLQRQREVGDGSTFLVTAPAVPPLVQNRA